MKEKERQKLQAVCDKIFDSPEYIERREEQSRYLMYYSGKYWPKQKDRPDAKESEIFANLIFSTVMTIAPMLTDNKPIWGLRARYPFLQPIANVYKAAGESLWGMEDMDAKVFQVVLDALIMKNGIAQVGFDPSRGVGGELSIEIIDPRTYFQAPGFQDNWQAPLCGTKTKRSLWWIRSNYPETGSEVQPDNAADSEKAGKTSPRGREEYEYMVDGEDATVYTVWLRDGSLIDLPTVNADGPKAGERTKAKKYPNGRFIVYTRDAVLEDKEYPYNHGKPPWVFLYDYIMPHSTFGIGEVDQIEGLTLEYNLFLRKFAKHCRLYADKNWLVNASAGIDPEESKAAIRKGGQVITYNGQDNPMVEVKVDPFDPSTLQFINGFPTIIQDINGVTDTSKGMASKKQRQSAHEITALLETSYTRTRQRVRNLEAFIKRLFTLVVELMQQFYSENRPFSLKNSNNETEWYEIENSRRFAETAMRPSQRPDQVKDEEEKAFLDQQWNDYAELMEYIGDEESVYFPFEVDVETNSTLPMDQQSLANLGLQLIQYGAIDVLSLLELLHIPNPERIVERLKAQAAMKAGGGGQPQAPTMTPQAMAAMMGGQQ